MYVDELMNFCLGSIKRGGRWLSLGGMGLGFFPVAPGPVMRLLWTMLGGFIASMVLQIRWQMVDREGRLLGRDRTAGAPPNVGSRKILDNNTYPLLPSTSKSRPLRPNPPRKEISANLRSWNRLQQEG